MLYLDYGRNPGEWTPNIYGTNENLDALEFLKHLNSVIKERNPGLLLVAQENGLWPELTDSVEMTIWDLTINGVADGQKICLNI